MTARALHFFVGNGDMTLFELDSGRTVLVDIRIRAGVDSGSSVPDVAEQLRSTLPRDEHGRLYVDVMMLTHPDEDHCLGLTEHFHLGPLPAAKTPGDRIVIREMWSSPIVFRRAVRKATSKGLTLCADAQAWAAEARRRVRAFEAGTVSEGDRIIILGEDEGRSEKMKRLAPILVRCGDRLSCICGEADPSIELHLLGPLPVDEDDTDLDKLLSKNNSSVISTFRLGGGPEPDAVRYLLGGDAEVGIWERLWMRYQADPSVFAFDVLIAPHHCSIHSLSHDSWSRCRSAGCDIQISPDARSTLSQARGGALIVSSSRTIVDDDSDPPCIRAKQEYESIVGADNVRGSFRTLADERGDGPMEIRIEASGWTRRLSGAPAIVTGGHSTAFGNEALGHGSDPEPL